MATRCGGPGLADPRALGEQLEVRLLGRRRHAGLPNDIGRRPRSPEGTWRRIAGGASLAERGWQRKRLLI